MKETIRTGYIDSTQFYTKSSELAEDCFRSAECTVTIRSKSSQHRLWIDHICSFAFHNSIVLSSTLHKAFAIKPAEYKCYYKNLQLQTSVCSTVSLFCGLGGLIFIVILQMAHNSSSILRVMLLTFPCPIKHQVRECLVVKPLSNFLF